MTKRPQLKAETRKVFGKKVKRLRKEGILPCSVYGKKIKSSSIQLNTDEFVKLFRQAGESAIVNLLVGKSATAHHVLIREIQKHPVTGMLLHASFQEVDLSEKIEADIPIHLEGESLAVKDKQALLLQELNEVVVEAAADSLPDDIKIDISKLTTVGDSIHIKDISTPKGVEIKNDPELVVVRLDELIAPESEELPEPETPKDEEDQPDEDTEGKQLDEKGGKPKEDDKTAEKTESTSDPESKTKGKAKNKAEQGNN